MKPSAREILQPGMVVQVDPDCRHTIFAGCFVTITEVKNFGIQGYVQALGTGDESGDKQGGLAYIGLKWEEFEFIGSAVWVSGSLSTDE